MTPGTTYEVVSPLGRSVTAEQAPAPPLSDIKGKKIGFVWTIFTNGDVLADVLMDLLDKKIGDFEGIKLPSGKENPWGDYPDEGIEDVVREAGVDAVIVTVGG